MTSEFIYQLLWGSIQSSVPTTTSMNTGKVLDNNVLKMYFLYSNALPEIPPLLSNQEGKDRFLTLGWGRSRAVSASENLYFFVASESRIRREHVSLPGFRKEQESGPQSSSAIFVSKKTPQRLELSGCLSCSQIYLDSSTNEIKLPLYHSLDCEE